MHRTTARTTAGLVVALALLTGCGGDGRSTGAPEPPETSAARPEPPAQTPSESPSRGFEGDPALAALDPCALVDAAGLASLGLSGGEPETLGQARVCRYRFEGPTLPETFTVSVEFFGTYGLDDLVVESMEPVPTVGDHEARRFIDLTGTCGVALGISDTSRVDVVAVGGEQDLACEHASALATAVEPTLPQGSSGPPPAGTGH